eukprot:GEMP01035208.1.p1 GENE.GEMP01035208.1~~GEMP01035208.1.p1  ORF type:complete len:319 (+),score=51.79 GEMP01035208.1:321-1277(+)
MADGLRMNRDTQSISHDFPENSLHLNGTRAGFHPPVNVTPSQTRANMQDIPPETRPRDRAALMSNFQERPLPRNVPAHAHHHTAPTAPTHVPTVPTRTFSHAGPTHTHPHAAHTHLPAVPRRTFSYHPRAAPAHTCSNAVPTHPHSHTTAPAQHMHQSSVNHTRHNAPQVPQAIHQRANTCLVVDPGRQPATDTYVPGGQCHNELAGGPSVVGAAVHHHLPGGAPSHHFQQHSTHIVPGCNEFVQQQTQDFLSHGGGAHVRGLDQRRHPSVPIIPTMYSNQPPIQQKTSSDGLPINNCPLPPDPGMASPITNGRLHRA